MEITKIKIRVLEKPHKSFNKDTDSIIAYASITLDDVFMLHGIKIIEDKYSNFHVGMPKQKLKDGSYKDIFHSVDKDFRSYMKEKIINAFMTRN